MNANLGLALNQFIRKNTYNDHYTQNDSGTYQVYSNVSYLDEVNHIIGPNDDGYGMLYYDGQFGSDALIDASNVD
ncbi:MAG: hypothetical protein JW942_05820 [Opitutales bacterium]|nr:hypothetical protein [Opitutales bacterium]